MMFPSHISRFNFFFSERNNTINIKFDGRYKYCKKTSTSNMAEKSQTETEAKTYNIEKETPEENSQEKKQEWVCLETHYTNRGANFCILAPTNIYAVNWTGGIRTKNVASFNLSCRNTHLDIIRARQIYGHQKGLNEWYYWNLFQVATKGEVFENDTTHVDWSKTGILLQKNCSLGIEYEKMAPGFAAHFEIEIDCTYDEPRATQMENYWLPINWNHADNYINPKTFKSDLYAGFDNLIMIDENGQFIYRFCS